MSASRPRPWRRLGAVALTLTVAAGVTACGPSETDEAGASSGRGDTVTVRIGYQSKTINTVTAGTLLRDLGLFEEKLEELSAETDIDYVVDWQDYPSGPPITTQMIAGKIDIGSMGDYPALVNGSQTQEFDDARSSLVSITGYNLRGSLNGVVVPLSSDARTLEDLVGQSVSTSLGSAGHGMLVSALDKAGLAIEDVSLVNQDPPVGAAALEGGQVAALAQFVPWPEVMVYRGFARKLYDGGDNAHPTMHGVVLREQWAEENPGIAQAFVEAQVEATEYLHEHPLEAAETVAEITGLEVEVIYLFNGPNGIVTFDPTIKPELVDALEADIPFLRSLGSLEELDVPGFVDNSILREVLGPEHDAWAGSTANPSAISGQDEVCGLPVDDAATASEIWLVGDTETLPAATPTCLLKGVAASGKELRVGYVPDTLTGTRMFAATASWVVAPAADPTERYLPFATLAAAEAYASHHPGTTLTDFETALQEV